jgi:hypothetical protein
VLLLVFGYSSESDFSAVAVGLWLSKWSLFSTPKSVYSILEIKEDPPTLSNSVSSGIISS